MEKLTSKVRELAGYKLTQKEIELAHNGKTVKYGLWSKVGLDSTTAEYRVLGKNDKWINAEIDEGFVRQRMQRTYMTTPDASDAELTHTNDYVTHVRHDIFNKEGMLVKRVSRDTTPGGSIGRKKQITTTYTPGDMVYTTKCIEKSY